MLDKGFLDDEGLSFKAKGILAYLLSKPDNWTVMVYDLENHSKDGREAVYSGLNELKKAGYYVKRPVRDEKGRVARWESIIYEDPAENPENTASYPLTGFPYLDNPYLEKPYTENAEHNNNYISKNNFNNNQSISQSDGLTGRDPTRENENGASLSPPASKRINETPNNHQEDCIMYRSLVQENIRIDDYISARPTDMPMVHELISVMVDVLCSSNSVIRINGENKPLELVKSQYMKIDGEDISHIIDRYRSVREEIKNIPAYLRSMLYSVKMDRDHFYENRVRSDGLI
jgi:hypothetical protein